MSREQMEVEQLFVAVAHCAQSYRTRHNRAVPGVLHLSVQDVQRTFDYQNGPDRVAPGMLHPRMVFRHGDAFTYQGHSGVADCRLQPGEFRWVAS